jgi:nucleotide-binding universal stress UspA family protein
LYERILVPLDGSQTAEAALAYAALLPSRQVRLLAVEHERADLTAMWWETRTYQDYLERVAEPLRQRGRAVETFVVSGNAAAQILAFTDTVDLVVMGSHGHGAMERLILGSVAGQVARQAPVPTMIVREGQAQGTPVRVERLVVPLDGSVLAEQAVPVASALAAHLSTPIHLMRVLDVDPRRAAVQAGIPAARASMRAREVDRRLAEQYLATRVQKLRNQGLAATAEVRLGNPVATLLDTIRPDDLVVMTSHGLGGIRRWVIGSVAEQLVRAAAGPVLLVRAADWEPLSTGTTTASRPANQSLAASRLPTGPAKRCRRCNNSSTSPAVSHS